MYNIRIKTSNIMTNHLGNYENENRTIRIPKVLRENLKVELEQQITINTTNNEALILKVASCYKNDSEEDNNICYVTKQIFELINIENTKAHEVSIVENITLGCDPEFFLIDNKTKHILKAHMFFNKWGEVGCDNILAELRPKPALTTDELTNNIFNLFCTARNILDINTVYDSSRISMLAMSSYKAATAGFHLHFGLPKNILGNNPNKINIMNQVVKVMDFYVGLPASMIEGSNDAHRRTNIFTNYGKPRDFRLDNKTLEYRVPGGHMLKHPTLTKGLIALGAIVVEDIISKIKHYTNNFKHLYWAEKDELFKEFYPNTPDIPNIFRLLCATDTYESKKHLDLIYSHIQNMISFNKEKKNIDTFFNHIYKNVQYTNDIEHNWRTFDEQNTELCRHQPKKTINCFGS